MRYPVINVEIEIACLKMKRDGRCGGHNTEAQWAGFTGQGTEERQHVERGTARPLAQSVERNKGARGGEGEGRDRGDWGWDICAA